jgi:hypothetical protein
MLRLLLLLMMIWKVKINCRVYKPSLSQTTQFQSTTSQPFYLISILITSPHVRLNLPSFFLFLHVSPLKPCIYSLLHHSGYSYIISSSLLRSPQIDFVRNTDSDTSHTFLKPPLIYQPFRSKYFLHQPFSKKPRSIFFVPPETKLHKGVANEIIVNTNPMRL